MDPIIAEMRKLAEDDFAKIPENDHPGALTKVIKDLQIQRVLYLLAAVCMAAFAGLMFYLYGNGQYLPAVIGTVAVPLIIISLSVLAVWFLQAAGGTSYNKWLKTLLLEATKRS